MFTVSKEDIEALKKKNYQIIFLFGVPGTGKGTQCSKLVTEFKYTHISTCDLIREQIQKNTPLGQQCHEYTIKGELIPSEMIIYILVKAIITHSAKKFLIDGFPRSMEQAMFFENNIKEIGIILIPN